LNMPPKSGCECLTETKQTEELKHIPVIIFSSSFVMSIVDLQYDSGTQFYIRKPGDYLGFKRVIFKSN
jgi:CheY-like chemotaxis protein